MFAANGRQHCPRPPLLVMLQFHESEVHLLNRKTFLAFTSIVPGTPLETAESIIDPLLLLYFQPIDIHK